MSKALLFGALSMSLVACGNSDSAPDTASGDTGTETGPEIKSRLEWLGGVRKHVMTER